MISLCLQLLIRILIIIYLRSTPHQASIESAINKFGSPPTRSIIPTAPHVQRLSSSTVLAHPPHRMLRSSLHPPEWRWYESRNTDNPLRTSSSRPFVVLIKLEFPAVQWQSEHLSKDRLPSSHGTTYWLYSMGYKAERRSATFEGAVG